MKIMASEHRVKGILKRKLQNTPNRKNRNRFKEGRITAVLLSGILLLQTIMPFQVFAEADRQPPTVPEKLIAAQVTETTVTLNWAASSDNKGVRGYYVYRDGRKIKSISKTSFTNTNLIPGQKYTYTVRAYDAAGNVSDYSQPLVQAARNDMQNPTQPAEPVILSKTHTSITVSWKASSDNTSVKGYEIYCNDKKVSTTTSTYYAVKSLKPGVQYSLYIIAYDAAGNLSKKSNTITAATNTDEQAPSIPAGLKTSSVTGIEIDLVWTASTDNVKLKNYEVFCNGIKLASSTKTSYSHKKLLPGKSFTYTVRAVDAAGNISGMSSELKISTPADREAPSAPAGLKVKSATKSSASLSWSASKDNLMVKGYKVYCNGIEVADTTKTHYNAKSPFRLGLDVFYVKAYDLAGNLSESSNRVTVITY